MVEIINTIRFSFPSNAARPSWDEIGDFVKKLNVSIPDIDTAYKVAEDKSICVKFKCERAFKNAVQNNAQSLRFHYADGTTVEVQMTDARGNFQYVRVCELPPEIPDRELLLVLEKYGRVKRVIREKVPASLGYDWFNGVRGVYMDVEKEIPPALHFLNWKGNIFYEGNKGTCVICKQKGHRMNSCPMKKSRHHQDNEKEEVRQPITYAGVVNGEASVENSNQASESVSIERAIRILEEDMETGDIIDPARKEEPHTKTSNKKMETKRQLSIESDAATGGTSKKQIVNDEISSDDGSTVTDPQAVPDIRTASDTIKRPSRYVDSRGKTFNFSLNNYKKH